MGRTAQGSLSQAKSSRPPLSMAPLPPAPYEHLANVKVFLFAWGRVCPRLATVRDETAAHEPAKEDVCCVPATLSQSALYERWSC
jgi:hypothetical protein